MTELVGYLGSALLLISFMMKEMKTLRWMNIIGCIVFIVYGAMLSQIPIIITNASIVMVNIYYLFIKKEEVKS